MLGMILSTCVGCSRKSVTIDSFCYTYGYVELPQELNDEALRLIDIGKAYEIEPWLIETVLNNRYYDDECR
jgi:hypothetical protein